MPTATQPTRDAAIEARVFWIRFQKEIMAVLIVALLAIAGWAGYRFFSERRATAAANLLGNAKSTADYRQVITQYPSTAAGASAYLLLAEAQRKEKKFAEANAILQEFISKEPQHELASAARLAMATNLESMGKPDEALSIYQQIVVGSPQSYITPFALLAQVDLLKTRGRTDEARRVCEKILTDYRESVVAGEASRQLRSLRPSPAASQPGTTSTNAPGPKPPPLLARPPAAAPPTAPTPVRPAKPK